ncbi:MAG: trigger factor [Gammaproteobacteria bacterium]|nr:MAG: trigger factor [Gammaproteobacteria bacterium]
MQVKVDILEGLQRKLTIEVPAKLVDKKVLQGLKKAQKSAKLDGFRKGKVPMKVVQQRYGAAVRQEVLGELIETSYSDAIKQEKLIPAAQPEIKPVSGFAENENFVYEAMLEVVPEFDVKGLDTLRVTKPLSEVKEADIDRMIDTLRQQATHWKVREGAAVEGDRVTIDFVGKIDGETFEGGSAEGVPVVLGAKQMLPEFETALFDKQADQEVTATVNFPEDYHGKEVAGKTAEFTISVKSVEVPELPEVDSEFVKRFGVQDGSVESLKQAIRDNMERELQNGLRNHVNQQVLKHLVESNPVVVPEGMVAQEKERMAHEQNLEQSIEDEAQRKAVIEERFDKPARRRVLLGLIMSKLFNTHKIEPDVARVEAQIKKIALTYEDPKEVIEHYQNNPQALEPIYAQVMEEQLIDLLLEKAEVTEEEKTFDEVMQAAVD